MVSRHLGSGTLPSCLLSAVCCMAVKVVAPTVEGGRDFRVGGMPGSVPALATAVSGTPTEPQPGWLHVSPLAFVISSLTALQACTVPWSRWGPVLTKALLCCFAQGHCFLGPSGPARPCDFGLHVRSVHAVLQGPARRRVRGVGQLLVLCRKRWLLWFLSMLDLAQPGPGGGVTSPSSCLQRLLVTVYVPFEELLPLGRCRWKLNGRNLP